MTELALALLVASVRVLAALALLPLGTLAPGRGAWVVRALIAAPLCLVVWPSTVPALGGLAAPELARVAVHELGVGLALGAAAALVLSVGRIAGGLLDAQLPGWRGGAHELGAGPLAGLYGLVTLTVFVLLDGHLALFEALLTSYTTVPVTAPPALATSLGALALHALERASALLLVATSAVLPALGAVALTEALLGVVARLARGSTPALDGSGLALSLRAAALLLAVLATLHASLALLSRWMLAEIAALP